MGEICPFCGSSIPPGSSICPLCGVPLSGSALPVGTRLKGRYSVGRVLGQGGFGITYKGADITLSRPVAIKELFPEGCIRNQRIVQPNHPDVQNEFLHIKQRFIEEARLLGRLNHPGIVKVYDYFEENNTAYMVMELLKGKSLRQLIEERGRIDEKEAVDYIKKVCEALSIVHKNGYLHRDIKPDNIFITDDGRVVLIDFGSAREFIAGRTKTHTVILTPGYAPLEQYSRVAERGPYTDIYALSATLYHMLTGEIPLDAPARQAGGVLRSPRAVNPKVSQTVSDAVMAGLEMDYKKRPQKIEDFHSLLEVKGKAAPPQQVALPQPIQQPAAQAAVAPSNIKGKIGKVFGALLGAFWWPIGFNVALCGWPIGGLLIFALLVALAVDGVSYGIMRAFLGLPSVKIKFYMDIIALITVRIVFLPGILVQVIFGIRKGAEWGERIFENISLSSFLLGLSIGATYALILMPITILGYSPIIWRISFFNVKYSILFFFFASFVVAIFSTFLCSIIYWLWMRKNGMSMRRKEEIASCLLTLFGIGIVFLILHFVPTPLHNKWFSILTNPRFFIIGFKNFLIRYWHSSFSFLTGKWFV